MSRLPKPHAGIMAVLMPFVILLLVLIALEPARAADLTPILLEAYGLTETAPAAAINCQPAPSS